MTAAIERSAILGGPADCYRYELRRVWDRRRPLLVVCMFNPSMADHEVDDPTILTLIHFGRSWGYGGILVINLWAYRTSSPIELKSVDDPFGDNASHVENALAYARANGGLVLAAWGNHGVFGDRNEWFQRRATRVHGVNLICLGLSKCRHPKHPMARGRHRIPRDQQPIMWREALQDRRSARRSSKP